MGGDNGGRREGFSGTTIKDTWTKPKRGGIRRRRRGWLGSGRSGGGKCRQLYLNNNKIIKKMSARGASTIALPCIPSTFNPD